MSRYYLLSQLPSLDGMTEGMPLPMTEERFVSLCGELLGKGETARIAALTLAPPRHPEKTGSRLIDSWNEGERDLRLALGKVRGEIRGRHFSAENVTIPPQAMQTARQAAEMTDPMAAERCLLKYRQELLESLRPTDPFSEDAVYYYGLKLKLVTRMRRFDPVSGEAAYREIYSKILNRERAEP